MVPDAETRQVISTAIKRAKLPVPDILPMTQTTQFRTSSQMAEAALATLRNCSPMAKSMTNDACEDSDAPLPIALPHTAALMRAQQQGRGGAGNMRHDSWPMGLVGSAVNLVRPLHKGHRGTLLYGLLGSTLVFETMQHAADYRQYTTQVIGAGED